MDEYRIGYIRTWQNGPTEMEQREFLEARHCEKIYQDTPKRLKDARDITLTERDDCIRTARPDVVFVVTEPLVWGRTPSERLHGLREIARISRNGARLLDLESGNFIKFTEESVAHLSFEERAHARQKSAQTANARAAQDGGGGRPQAISKNKKTEARKAWADPGDERSKAQLARDYGVSAPTMNRYLEGVEKG